jgi:CobQ-like glutamine amidotransferase family enzyme
MKKIKIVHLWAKELNIYGDDGNVLILRKRLEWRGIESEVIVVGIDDQIPDDANLIVAGGGQDSNQLSVTNDVKLKKDKLKALAKRGVPMLLICGSYQLFGQYFITRDGQKIEGLDILDITTEGSNQRLVGNIKLKTEFGEMFGFENHSGVTEIIPHRGTRQLGWVSSGFGNNGRDGKEGAIKFNVFGTYMHGPVLSKNPQFADHLLRLALDDAFIITELKPLDDSLEDMARARELKRDGSLIQTLNRYYTMIS